MSAYPIATNIWHQDVSTDNANTLIERVNFPGLPRNVAVREVKQGKHPGAHIVKIKGREYVRDNPDRSTADNVNRNKDKKRG